MLNARIKNRAVLSSMLVDMTPLISSLGASITAELCFSSQRGKMFLPGMRPSTAPLHTCHPGENDIVLIFVFGNHFDTLLRKEHFLASDGRYFSSKDGAEEHERDLMFNQEQEQSVSILSNGAADNDRIKNSELEAKGKFSRVVCISLLQSFSFCLFSRIESLVHEHADDCEVETHQRSESSKNERRANIAIEQGMPLFVQG